MSDHSFVSVPRTFLPEVVHIFSSLARGGAESRTLELLEWIGSHSRNVHATVFQVGQPGNLSNDFISAGATVVTQRFRTAAFWRRLVRTLRAPSTLALHLHVKRGNTRPAVLLPLAALAGVPTRIVHFRSDGSDLATSTAGRLAEWVNYRLIDTMATDVVGVSPASLERGWSHAWEADKRCRVMMSGLSLSRFSGLAASGRLGGLIGSNDDDVLMVHVGRDMPVKNRPRAVEILAALNEGRFRLIFIGRNDPASTEALAQLARAHGVEAQVHFLGERDDVPQLMADADLTILSSIHEGLPGVVLESLAAGTPVLATDLPGTRFIADRLDAVTLVRLEDSDDTWADAARRAVEPSAGYRPDHISRQLTGSAFDMDRAAEEFITLWTLRSRGPARQREPVRASRQARDPW